MGLFWRKLARNTPICLASRRWKKRSVPSPQPQAIRPSFFGSDTIYSTASSQWDEQAGETAHTLVATHLLNVAGRAGALTRLRARLEHLDLTDSGGRVEVEEDQSARVRAGHDEVGRAERQREQVLLRPDERAVSDGRQHDSRANTQQVTKRW
jgi:hypothetical protein